MSIFLVNPYKFAVAAPNFTRVVFNTTYNATGGSSGVGTTFVTRDTLNTTETAGKSYSIFWQMRTGHGSATNDSRVQLVESATNRNAQNLEPQDTSDFFSQGGLHNYAGGTNKTFTLQTSGENNSTHTWDGYQTTGLEHDATDLIASEAANTTTTGQVNALSLALTAATNFYVISYGEALALSVANPRVGTGSTSSEMLTYGKDTTNWVPYWDVESVTGGTAFIRLTAASGTATLRNKYITALREDKFANTWFASNTGANTTTTSITYVSGGISLTFTPDNPSNKHLILASAILNGSSTTVSVKCKLRNTTDAVDYNTEHFREATNINENYVTSVARVVTFASGGSKTIEWQISSETTAATASLKHRKILVIDLGTT